METSTKNSGWKKTFSIWFGIGALMFGQMCGGASASGAYSIGYWARYGGGWMIPFILTFILFASFCSVVGLMVVRAYDVTNYSQYFQAIWGVRGDDANPWLKRIVTVFFDIYLNLTMIMAAAACIALFGEMMNILLGLPMIIGGLMGCVLFAVLAMYGAGFLRKANGFMTITLVAVMFVILGCVIGERGDVLANMIGNFEIGPDWHEATPTAFYSTIIAYCAMQASAGSSLASFADQMRHKKDCIGSGICAGVMQGLVFLLTSLIILPYLPEQLTSAAPILVICQRFAPVITIVYYIMILFSAASTAPTFVYSFSARFMPMWKSESVSPNVKRFIMGVVYLIVCYVISLAGMMAIVQKGYALLGGIGGIAAGIPMLIAIPRTIKKLKEKDAAAAE